jgi:hypothetical protein
VEKPVEKPVEIVENSILHIINYTSYILDNTPRNVYNDSARGQKLLTIHHIPIRITDH